MTRTRPAPLDFDQMERDMADLTGSINHTQPPPADYAPRRIEPAHMTATQIIAQGITHLTWKEAETMGEGIQAHVKDGIALTDAIQAWAAGWENFK